jgi:outer membrane protease
MDNARHVHRQTLKKKTLLTLALLLGGTATVPGSLAAAPAADRAPAELKMILSPGRNNAGAITFRTEGEGETAGQAAVSGASQATAPGSSPKPVVKAVDPSPTTVQPAEANTQSIAERGELALGKARPRILAYPNSFSMGVGYRWDDLHWVITDSDKRPSFASVLEYDNLESATLSADMRWSNSSNIYVRGGVDIGRTLSGDERDSDYLFPTEPNNFPSVVEFSRSTADCDSGSLLDANIGVGYRFDLPFSDRDQYLRLMPLVGFSYHSQELEVNDGVQILSEYGFSMPLGPFDGLDSNYDAHWAGPWAGIDMELALNQRHALLASFEYHWVDYEADADWNLRSDFSHPVSFEHESDGDGIIASITYRFTPNPKWFWTLGYKYSKFEADWGEDTTYFSDGTIGKDKLYEAEWESHAVMVGLGYRF